MENQFVTHIRLKLCIVGLALGTGVLLLAVAGVREGWVYYLPVDQFVENASYQHQRVRLHGSVGEADFQVNSAALVASFQLLGESRAVHVRYEGVIPEMFQAGRDVVVEGCLNDSGEFVADTLLTKCASKYESSDGQAPHADPHSGPST